MKIRIRLKLEILEVKNELDVYWLKSGHYSFVIPLDLAEELIQEPMHEFSVVRVGSLIFQRLSAVSSIDTGKVFWRGIYSTATAREMTWGQIQELSDNSGNPIEVVYTPPSPPFPGKKDDSVSVKYIDPRYRDRYSDAG